MPYRIAKSGEFTFKRDSAGVETVEHNGCIIATLWPKGHITIGTTVATIAAMMKAKDVAQRAGFWTMGTPAATTSPVSVTVQVGP